MADVASADVQGTCSNRFEPVRAALADRLASGNELGASIVINVGGETVADMWGGFRDEARTVPWTKDTITNVWSTTKTVTNLAALMLADRAELDVYAPIARYWPEYAANGKQDSEVRHLLSHTSGVSGWDQPFRTTDMYDWDKATPQPAGQAPGGGPGAASCDPRLNPGHMVGELIRRIT